MQFAEENKCHIWLSAFCNDEHLNKLIYGYGKPVYISFTHKPLGILVVIYEDGVAVDLEIIEKIDILDSKFFHTDDIKLYSYTRNEELCKKFSLKEDMHYQTARLFHRSLIKFLSGKKEMGVSIANEIAIFSNCNIFIGEANYRESIINLLTVFNDQYQLSLEYYAILCGLMEKL